MPDYVSSYSGEKIDEAVGRALPGGTLDTGKAPAGMVSARYVVRSNEEIESAIAAAYTAMGNNVERYIVLNVNVGGLVLPGGEWNFRMCRTTADYGWLSAVTYVNQGNSPGPCEIKRALAAGVWGDWEWENPPLLLGYEYRTTKRYMGKPVYVKTINGGALPAFGGSTSYEVSDFSEDVSYFIKTHIYVDYYGVVLPLFNALGELRTYFSDTGILGVYNSSNGLTPTSQASVYITRWYIKKTD